MLQKRRELKAAGVETGNLDNVGIPKGQKGKNKRSFIDYAREIPFQKVPQVGFFDTNNESIISEKTKLSLNRLELAQLEGQRTQAEENMMQDKEKER